jgi:hypothetical protein
MGAMTNTLALRIAALRPTLRIDLDPTLSPIVELITLAASSGAGCL